MRTFIINTEQHTKKKETYFVENFLQNKVSIMQDISKKSSRLFFHDGWVKIDVIKYSIMKVINLYLFISFQPLFRLV